MQQVSSCYDLLYNSYKKSFPHQPIFLKLVRGKKGKYKVLHPEDFLVSKRLPLAVPVQVISIEMLIY